MENKMFCYQCQETAGCKGCTQAGVCGKKMCIRDRCKPMLKLSKFSRNKFGDVIGKRVPVYLSSFVVWFTTGIWHGASWNFIVWGPVSYTHLDVYKRQH